MNLDALLNGLTPEMYERLRHGAETGKWPDGTPLEQAQRDHAVQIVMLYQSKVEQSNQQFTVGSDGQIVQKSKAELKKSFATDKEIVRFNETEF